jgi:tRNA G10  N-methylase Trm11
MIFQRLLFSHLHQRIAESKAVKNRRADLDYFLVAFLMEDDQSSLHSLLNRKVQFSDKGDEIFYVINRKDICSNERKMAWYRKSELKRFLKEHKGERKRQQKNEKIIKSKGNWLYTTDRELLELPSKDVLARCQRTFLKSMTILTVLQEQQLQKAKGIKDPYTISQKYQALATKSRRDMFITALIANERRRKSMKRLLIQALIEPKGEKMALRFRI